MNILLYILMFIPAVIMIIIGYAITEARKDSTMTSHHFAGNFNIKKYAKKVMTLFTFTGIIFSLGGILIISGKTAFGIACREKPPQALVKEAKNLPRVSVAFFRDHPDTLEQSTHTCEIALWQCF